MTTGAGVASQPLDRAYLREGGQQGDQQNPCNASHSSSNANIMIVSINQNLNNSSYLIS
jgi:hypothetical protein